MDRSITTKIDYVKKEVIIPLDDFMKLDRYITLGLYACMAFDDCHVMALEPTYDRQLMIDGADGYLKNENDLITWGKERLRNGSTL